MLIRNLSIANKCFKFVCNSYKSLLLILIVIMKVNNE